MNETVARFGPRGALVGVLTEPGGEAEGRDLPTALLLNAGLLHHVGPNRLSVRLARRLSRLGIRSFRFDLSGIGDSGSREDLMPRSESVVRETQDAMDYLAERRGVSRFVIFGICSGAEQACSTGLVDPRAVGAVLVDGLRYRTRGFYWRHYGRRLVRPRSWSNLVTGRNPAVARLLRRKTAGDASSPVQRPQLLTPFPPREEGEVMLCELLNRIGKLLLIYSQGSLYNHLGQVREMFPKLAADPCVRVEFLPYADHMFTLLWTQDALIGAVEAWMEQTDFSRSGEAAAQDGRPGGRPPSLDLPTP